MKNRATYLVSLAVMLVATLTVMAVQQSPKTAEDSKTIELDASHALAYANRGVVKVLLKRSDYAADFEAAFRLNPSLRASYSKFYESRRRP